MNYIQKYNSPFGEMLMLSDGTVLTGLVFDGQKYFENKEVSDYVDRDLQVFKEVKEWLDIYFDGKKPDFIPPISLNGSDFRKAVWEILMTIPYGQVCTYGDIAKKIAAKRGIARMSAQAVGGAVGHNPIAIIVPCHRVIGTNGSLIGYAGGLDKKEALLRLEGIHKYLKNSN